MSAADPSKSDVVAVNGHIVPMLPEPCASCHRPGLAGPLPLLTYENAAQRAEPISVVTQTGSTLRW